MLADLNRWNEKYSQNPPIGEASLLIKDYLNEAKVGQALDIACGQGRNTDFLAQKGFIVDAVDGSNIALSKLKNTSTINKIEADLDKYCITPNKYDLIINFNYLNRRLIPQIKDGLKSGGVLMFETFLLAHGDFKLETMNLDYLLRKNELLHSFIGLDIVYYEEKVVVNSKGEKVKVASLVAKKA